MASKVRAKKKNEPVPKKDNKKIARTRRSRGYHWEDTLVKRFNAVEGWKAFRLGSPSVALPDILAISTKNSTIFTIEAKSGTTNSLVVPSDQIQRCLKWVDTFELYGERKVVFAFKFLSKKRIGLGLYEKRELREFYKVWDSKNTISDFACNYDGNTYSIIDAKRQKISLEDYKMPFYAKNAKIAMNEQKA
ncbi:MAG TPA: resolvase [Candidatus Nitrosotenuis sp.]|nr:resolvase [Candidatus Nitrosotenuis sp.]